ILAIEYLSAIEKFNRVINPVCIKRFGVGHDSPEVDNVSGVASASTLRQLISNNQFDSVFRYMPPASYSVIRQAYENGEFADINRISTAIISKLRTMNTQNYSQLPDISEGLEHRIKKAVEQSCDLQSLYTNIKTKRYTLARIKRIIMSAFLDIDNTVNKQPLEYIRILGCNQNGIELIKQNMQKSPVPIALRTTNITDTKQFKLECRATDLYNLALIRPKRMNIELTSGLITDIL
ncbi:MAG: nucleotidyltransferase family protein, partial [bacterium]|nr:nucleotidyltransferase family protein [bacterium]